MDLTWDRDRLVEGQSPKWLLKSDKEFNTDKHPYYRSYVKKYSCEESLEEEVLEQYLKAEHVSSDPDKKFINEIIKDVTISDMQGARQVLEYSTHKEKSEVCVEEHSR